MKAKNDGLSPKEQELLAHLEGKTERHAQHAKKVRQENLSSEKKRDRQRDTDRAMVRFNQGGILEEAAAAAPKKQKKQKLEEGVVDIEGVVAQIQESCKTYQFDPAEVTVHFRSGEVKLSRNKTDKCDPHFHKLLNMLFEILHLL